MALEGEVTDFWRMRRVWPAIAGLNMEGPHFQEMGTSLLQPQGTKFCQKPEWVCKQIVPQSFHKGMQPCPCETLSREPSQSYLDLWPSDLQDNKWVLLQAAKYRPFVAAAIETKTRSQSTQAMALRIKRNCQVKQLTWAQVWKRERHVWKPAENSF